MNPHLMRPAAAAEAPVAVEHPVAAGRAKARLKNFGEHVKSVLYYGLLLFGFLVPVLGAVIGTIFY